MDDSNVSPPTNRSALDEARMWLAFIAVNGTTPKTTSAIAQAALDAITKRENIAPEPAARSLRNVAMVLGAARSLLDFGHPEDDGHPLTKEHIDAWGRLDDLVGDAVPSTFYEGSPELSPTKDGAR